MARKLSLSEPPQSLGEEIANSVSHGLATLAALVAAPPLILAARRQGDAATTIGAAVFVGTVVLLYLCSTLYHALARNRAKRVFRLLDHSAIFLLIAGTYTPFMLGALRGPWGWSLLAVVWALAALGVVMTAASGLRFPSVNTLLYLALSWMLLIAVKPLLRAIPLAGLLWLLAGGLAYSGGIAFFAARRLRYGHLIWHFCVMAGTACHFIAVLRYAP
jgi:hemolysin III